MDSQTTRSARFSIFSLIAILCAFLSFSTGALLGFVLAGIAIVCGIIGVLLAIGPGTRGGLISIFSMIAGCIGILAAVIKAFRAF